VKDLDFKRPFSINLAAAIFAPKQNVNLKMLIGPFSAQSDYNKVALDGEINIDPLDLNQVKKAVPKMVSALPKDFEIGGIFKVADLKLKGTLHDLALNGSIEGTQGAVNYGKSFQKPAGIPLAVEGAAHYSNDKLAIRQTVLKLHTLTLQAQGDIVPGNPAVINLSLAAEPTSLQGWEKLIPAVGDYRIKGKMDLRATVHGPVGSGRSPQIQGNLTLQNAAVNGPGMPKPIENLNAVVNFSGQRAELKETNFNLGVSPIRLAAVIDKFSPLAVSYNLKSSELALADIQASLQEERRSDVLRNVSSDGQITAIKGQTTVVGRIVSRDGRLYSTDYKNLDANLSYGNGTAVIRNFRANALNGSLRLSGEYGFDVPKFSIGSEVKGIDLVQLYQYFNQEQRDIRGNLNGDLKLSGVGDKWQEIKPNLRGDGQMEVQQGTLLNFNIADAVLSGVTGIPGLANLINPAVRQKYPETFNAKDTVFKDLQSQITVGDSRLNFKNLRIAAAQFKLEGDGWADFDRRVDIRGVVRFSPELSADITKAVREIRFLFNRNNELEIPFIFAGQMPNVRPRPDTSYLTKSLQRGLVQRGAEELFGTRERNAPDDRPQDERRQQRQSSPEDLIRKGLEGLFGRQKRQ
jgi:autotransporter translocation and assembly factor TamB